MSVFFSVAFAFAVAVWLYAWQTEKANSGRKEELRAAQVISVFDTWDRLNDSNLQTAELPDGSEVRVLLTQLQPIVFEESIKSGLFGTSETLIMSRLTALIHIYNNAVQSLMPLVKEVGSAPVESVDEKRLDHLRSEIDSVLEHREKVVEAGRRMLERWSLKDLRKALALANEGDQEEVDPRVAQLVEDALPKVSPPSYKAAIYEQMDKAREAFEAGDRKSASQHLDDAAEEVQKLRDSKITDGSAEDLLAAIASAKESLETSSQQNVPA